MDPKLVNIPKISGRVSVDKPVNVIVGQRFFFLMHNRDCCMGQYDSSDDWNIEIYGKTIQEIIEQAPQKMLQEEISVDCASLSLVNVFILNGEIIHTVEITNYSPDYGTLLVNEIVHTKKYQQLKTEFDARAKAAEKRKKEQEKQQQEAEQRKQYEKLRAKFGD